MTEPSRLPRRRLLAAGGLGAALLGGGWWSRRGGGEADPAVYGHDHAHGHGGHAGDAHAELERLGLLGDGYGHGPQPPRDLDRVTIEALTHPPARDDDPPGTVRDVDMAVSEVRWPVADGAAIDAWTYGGRVPGPVVRATEGDRLRLHLDNRTGRSHNLHLHGSHDPQMDGWQPIPPGEGFTYDVEAGPAGLHPYHCHLPPFGEHVRRGLYGLVIVDPPEPREPAVEVVLALCGFDLDGDGQNEVYGFNGVCGLYDRHPIQVPVGELVRVYVANLIEGEAPASFHLHAQTFDVYRSGTSTSPDEHTDQVTLGQADRAVLEFRLPKRGRYMFHPHQHRLVERGAMGWFTAI